MAEQYPPGTQENYNSFSSKNPITEKDKELEYRRAGGGKGYRGHEVASTLRREAPLREPGVPPIMADPTIRTFENVLKTPEKRVKTERVKQKRVITGETKWNFKEGELSYENQWSLINQIHEKKIINREHCALIMGQIRGKISGYRNQDVLKKLFNEDVFVDEEYVIERMIDARNYCYYCKNSVDLLYEYVRATKQWTLDRLDNSIGHNKNNCVIACLGCNLRRKTMHHERYVFTKQLGEIRKVDA